MKKEKNKTVVSGPAADSGDTGDNMEKQQAVQFLEQTAALAGVLIIALALLDLLGVFDDRNLYILLFVLGAFMNVMGAVREHYKSNRLRQGLETGAAVICLAAVLYLLFF